MPELPEVEQVAKGLRQLVIGKKISQVDVSWPRIISGMTPDLFSQTLLGQTISAISRRGKYLIFTMDRGVMISHLRMEGKYIFRPSASLSNGVNDPQHKHVHVSFIFKDGSRLDYQDVRKFGRMEWLGQASVTEYFKAKGLGPEPDSPDFDLASLKVALKKTDRMIKPLLLDQKLVAGVGNIYADEILFQAKIKPDRKAKSLTAKEVSGLHQAVRDIMKRAVQAGGSTVRTYLDGLGQKGSFQDQLKVYGRQDQPCLVCGRPISKRQLAQRGTHYCNFCQR